MNDTKKLTNNLELKQSHYDVFFAIDIENCYRFSARLSQLPQNPQVDLDPKYQTIEIFNKIK